MKGSKSNPNKPAFRKPMAKPSAKSPARPSPKRPGPQPMPGMTKKAMNMSPPAPKVRVTTKAKKSVTPPRVPKVGMPG